MSYRPNTDGLCIAPVTSTEEVARYGAPEPFLILVANGQRIDLTAAEARGVASMIRETFPDG